MMNQEVIVHVVRIGRIGDRVHFQIPIPADARRIVAFEYGVLGKDGDPIGSPLREVGPGEDTSMIVQPNKSIGRLSLQSPGSESVFFENTLVDNRNQFLNEGISSLSFQPFEWTHSRKSEELILSVDSNTRFIEGFFHDSFGTGEYETLEYNLHLYLWIEKCNS